MAPGAEVGAAGRAHVLEAVRLFSDDFGPLLFPCSSEVRSGFASAPPPPPLPFYTYIFSPKLHLKMQPLFCRAAASHPEHTQRFTQPCWEPLGPAPSQQTAELQVFNPLQTTRAFELTGRALMHLFLFTEGKIPLSVL